MNPYKKHFEQMRKAEAAQKRKSKKRLQRKRQNPIKNKHQKPLLGLCVGLFLLTAYGLLYPEIFSGVSEASFEIGFLSQGLAEEGAVSTPSKGTNKEKSANSKSGKDTKKKPVKDPAVYKSSSYISKLMAKEKDIEQREERVKNLEVKLQKEEVELEKKIERLEQARRDIASRLDRRVKEDEESIMKLVGIYSNMKAQNAAFLLMKLDQNLAVSVLKKMKKREAGSILNFVDPKIAKNLSEKYSGY